MKKCKKCKEEINYLINVCSGYMVYSFDGDYGDSDFEIDGNVNNFECPNCNEVLFTNEEEANDFLNSKEEKNEESISSVDGDTDE